MAETYTKPFESVQVAISLFEQRIDVKKNTTCSNKEKKGELLKDFTNCRLQLEGKEHEKDLAVFEFDAPHRSPKELLTWLKLYKAETDKYKEKFRKAQELFFEFEKGDGSRMGAQKQAEMMKTTITAEKKNVRDLSMHASEFNQLLPIEPEVFQSQKQSEVLTRQLEEMEVLESELLKEMIIGEYLHMELKQSKEAQAFSSKYAISTRNELDLVRLESEKMKLISSERGNYIIWLEEEGKRVKELVQLSLEKMNGINSKNEMLLSDIQRMQEEICKSNNRELELQAKVTNLTSQLQNSDEEPEIDEAKKEKVEADDVAAASSKTSASAGAGSNGFCTGIVISMEEYDFLIQKSAMDDTMKSSSDDGYEIDRLKRELENRNAEISGLTCRLETTSRRAEMAEKAKLEVEAQLRVWKEQKRLRRAASEALKEYVSMNPEAERQHTKPVYTRTFSKPGSHVVPSVPKRSVSMFGRKSKYIPLGKYLKIKF